MERGNRPHLSRLLQERKHFTLPAISRKRRGKKRKKNNEGLSEKKKTLSSSSPTTKGGRERHPPCFWREKKAWSFFRGDRMGAEKKKREMYGIQLHEIEGKGERGKKSFPTSVQEKRETLTFLWGRSVKYRRKREGDRSTLGPKERRGRDSFQLERRATFSRTGKRGKTLTKKMRVNGEVIIFPPGGKGKKEKRGKKNGQKERRERRCSPEKKERRIKERRRGAGDSSGMILYPLICRSKKEGGEKEGGSFRPLPEKKAFLLAPDPNTKREKKKKYIKPNKRKGEMAGSAPRRPRKGREKKGHGKKEGIIWTRNGEESLSGSDAGHSGKRATVRGGEKRKIRRLFPVLYAGGKEKRRKRRKRVHTLTPLAPGGGKKKKRTAGPAASDRGKEERKTSVLKKREKGGRRRLSRLLPPGRGRGRKRRGKKRRIFRHARDVYGRGM